MQFTKSEIQQIILSVTSVQFVHNENKELEAEYGKLFENVSNDYSKWNTENNKDTSAILDKLSFMLEFEK